ncbi:MULTISPECIES: hypothetical protein [unclassified Priestia]|uniref:hypothetical protein n=1 Tax=unclassified Priestia TaxID=2800374 RepID=UPI00366B6578
MKKNAAGFIFCIIGLILNVLVTIGLIISVINFNIISKKPSYLNELKENFQNDSSLNNSDVNQIMDIIKKVISFSNSYGWLIILLFVLSVILTIVYVLKLKKKENSTTSLKLIFLGTIFSFVFSPGALCLIISIIFTYFHKRKILRDNTHEVLN